MHARGLMFATVLGLAALLCACGSGPAADKATPQQANAASPPDLTGLWQLVGMRGGPDPYQSGDYVLKNQPPETQPELLPEVKARQEQSSRGSGDPEHGGLLGQLNSRAARTMLGQCVPYGMPYVMGDPVESIDILQAKTHLVMVLETSDTHEVRRIWMDRPQLPIDQIDPSAQGRSVGKWEGNTLVINTAGFLREEDDGNTADMAVTERLHLEGSKLINEVTVTDPTVYAKPWVSAYHYERIVPANYEPFQGGCENSDQYRFDEKANLIIGKE